MNHEGVHISMLFSSLIVHAFTPNGFNEGTIFQSRERNHFRADVFLSSECSFVKGAFYVAVISTEYGQYLERGIVMFGNTLQ